MKLYEELTECDESPCYINSNLDTLSETEIEKWLENIKEILFT